MLTSGEAALHGAILSGNTDEVCRILSMKNPPDLNKAVEPRYLNLAVRKGKLVICWLKPCIIQQTNWPMCRAIVG